jgi:hypothetical protein
MPYYPDLDDDLDSSSAEVFWWCLLALGAAIFLLCL